MSGRQIHVVAGVLSDASGRVLVARRRSGTHLAGRWEFPGGKLAPGEARADGLARELAEELGIRTLAAHPLIWVEHRYPDRDIVLDVWRVVAYAGRPYGREGQPIEWRDIRRLDSADFPPADAPVLGALRLPRRYLVTPEPGRDWSAFLDRLAARVAHGFALVQLRAKFLEDSALVDLGARAAEICRRGGAQLLVNADPEIARRCGAHGVHLTSERLARAIDRGSASGAGSIAVLEEMFGGALDIGPPSRRASRDPRPLQDGQQPVQGAQLPGGAKRLAQRQEPAGHAPPRPGPPPSETPPPGAPPSACGGGRLRAAAADAAPEPRRLLLGASCHDAGDLERARVLGCDFAVLGAVRETATHPGVRVLRWPGFERLARGAGLPVFAIGGLSGDDLDTAARRGGQGVAAIRGFWGV